MKLPRFLLSLILPANKDFINKRGSRVRIYKNKVSLLDTGFSKDYEKFKQEMGTYSIIGLLLKLLEDKPDLWNKIMQQKSFVLNNDEKNTVAKKMEEYIENIFIISERLRIWKVTQMLSIKIKHTKPLIKEIFYRLKKNCY